MKKTVELLIFLFFWHVVTAQVPQGFNYQAIARDATGAILENKTIPLELSIQTSTGTVIWQEKPTITTNKFGLIQHVIGTSLRIAGSAAHFSDIDWNAQPLYLKTRIQYPELTWNDMGSTQIWSVPYSLVARDLEGPVSKLGIEGTTSLPDEALFEVKNRDGQTVFAVYNEGVKVFVDDLGKGAKGGFTVSGFNTNKADPNNYLLITGDSIRMFVDSNPLTKGAKGGFTVSGFDMLKGATQDYLDVSSENVKVYIDDTGKGAKGGFTVAGFNNAKGNTSGFFNVAIDETGVIDPSENRVLWYPLKNALLAGRVYIPSPGVVGENSFASGYESQATGNYSQALGYKTAAVGDYSTAIGRKARAELQSSFAFGDSAIASGRNSYAFGNLSMASGNQSFAFGSWDEEAGYPGLSKTEATGENSMAIGLGTLASGSNSISLGGLGTYSILTSVMPVVGRNSASGNSAMTLGYGNQSTKNYGVAIGIGNNTAAYRGNTFGYHNTTKGEMSISAGIHSYISINGKYSTVLGYGLLSNEQRMTVVGSLNDTASVTGAQFVIGNGYMNFLSAVRKNAFIVHKTGNVLIPGNLQIATGASASPYSLDVNGEIASRTANSFRLRGSSYSSILRQDGTDFYLLLTASGDPDGNWNALRPFRVALATGHTYIGNGSLTILHSGNVGIGTSTPAYKLQVGAAGDGSQARANAWNLLSDESLKSGFLRPANVLEMVQAINGYYFYWTTGTDKKRQFGISAQEVEKVLPEIVSKGDDGLLSVDYGKITPLLIEALKEQQKQIDKMESRILELEKQLSNK